MLCLEEAADGIEDLLAVLGRGLGKPLGLLRGGPGGRLLNSPRPDGQREEQDQSEKEQ